MRSWERISSFGGDVFWESRGACATLRWDKMGSMSFLVFGRAAVR